MFFYFSKPTTTAKKIPIDYDFEAKGADWTNTFTPNGYWADVIEQTYLPFFVPFATVFPPEDVIREGLIAAQIKLDANSPYGENLNQWRDYKLLALGATPDQLPDGAQGGTGLYNPNLTATADKIKAVKDEAEKKKFPIYRNGYVALGAGALILGLGIWAVRALTKKGKK